MRTITRFEDEKQMDYAELTKCVLVSLCLDNAI
jgi:hypothetical protein